MQQNQGQQNNQDETAETEDEGIGVGTSKQNKMLIIIVITVFVSGVFYFMFLREPSEDGEEQMTNEIVIDNNGVQPIRGSSIDYDPSVIDTVLPNSEDIFQTPRTDSTIPDMPELPQLTDDLKQQIAANTAKKEETFTKEEVDSMIEEKMKEFMEKQMSALANMNQRGEQSENKEPTGFPILAPQQSQNNNRRNNGNVIDDGLDMDDIYEPNAKKKPKVRPNSTFQDEEDNLSEAEMLAKQQKEEADNLAKIQKQRALQERKAAPIFKMSGGNGPSNSIPQDSDSIILSYTDAKLDIKSKAPDVMPTQVADLTRVILQGKVIAAVLETAIDTDLSSTVRAVITRDVYAEEGKNILIPRGSRVVGTYATNISAGQTRVTINWNRIIRVDGMSLNIASIGADRLGRAGVQGDLDNKYAQQLANSFLSSVLSVGTSLAVEKMSGSTGITSTISSLTGDTTQTSGKASDYALIDATQQFMDDAKKIVDDIADQKPVIRVPQGEKVTIMVTQDVTLPIFKRGGN